jgi:hypothetical protein
MASPTDAEECVSVVASNSTLRTRRTGVPLAVWALAAVTVAVAAWSYGYVPWHPYETWSRYDSGLYADIARDGYQLFRCTDGTGNWCGDAGWFPAYSWLVGAVHLTGASEWATGAVVAWLLGAATIVVLWATFLERRTDAAAVGALVYAAFAPGQIYHFAIFPLSLYAVSTVGCLWLVYSGRYVLGGLAGTVAALAYPAGLLLAPAIAIWLLAQRSVHWTERLRRVSISSGLVLVSAWVLVIDQWLEVGHWNAYLLVQEKYHHEWQSPFGATWDLLTGNNSGAWSAFDVAVALQTALVTAVLVAVIVRSFHARVGLASADALVLVWALGTWALPLSQTGVSTQRGQATLLPLAILVSRLPWWLAWAFALSAVALAIWMEHYFLDSVLF